MSVHQFGDNERMAPNMSTRKTFERHHLHPSPRRIELQWWSKKSEQLQRSNPRQCHGVEVRSGLSIADFVLANA